MANRFGGALVGSRVRGLAARAPGRSGSTDRGALAAGVAAGLAAALLAACATTEPPPPRTLDLSGSFEPPPSTEAPFLDYGERAAIDDDDAEPIDFPSCDQARETHVESIDLATPGSGPPDIPASAYSDVLGRGTYLARCQVPSDAAVTVCAAVINGQAVGISVELSPHHQGIANCLVEAIQRLEFPSHPKLDVATTRFAPSR